jgi:hypothetical protein
MIKATSIMKLLEKFAKYLALAAFVSTGLTVFSACGQGPVQTPPSLNGPRAMAVADGSVCLNTFESPEGILRPRTEACDSTGDKAIGLVAMQREDRVGILDMSRRPPQMVDMARTVPGINHIPVGMNPIDVAASSDGTAGFVLSQTDSTITVLNLWALEAVGEIDVPGTANELESLESTGEFVVTASNPSRLLFYDEVNCSQFVDDGACDPISDRAEPSSLPTPGQINDISIGPDGEQLYAVYQNQPFASVFELSGDSADSCLKSGVQPPCESNRIGLTYGCMDHIDNDGDGRVDQADTQCFRPDGRESRSGIGRAPLGTCNNGVDDDGDGEADRDDSDCQLGSDSTEAESTRQFSRPPRCLDERDNDSDGRTDYPADASCYGVTGDRESSVTDYGAENVAIGPMGAFLYAVDRAEEQLLVADLQRGQLIDAHRAVSESREAFSSRVGVPLGGTPFSVVGDIQRNVVNEEGAGTKVQYNYSALVATDSGTLERIDILRTNCALQDDVELVGAGDFSYGSDALADAAESECLKIPEFPIAPNPEASSCQIVRECEDCRDSSESADCPVCDGVEVAREECERSGRIHETKNAKLAWNPLFARRDGLATPANVSGANRCETPPSFEESLRAYFRDNPDGPQIDRCTLPLRPQPVAPTTAVDELEADVGIQRAAIRTRKFLELEQDNGSYSPLVVPDTDDHIVRNETWEVVFEGVLPATARNDGLVGDSGNGRFDPGAVGLCEADVREGDRLTIKTRPPRSTGDACRSFVNSEEGTGYRTWRVEEVNPSQLSLSVIEEDEGTDEYADELPGRECFPAGISYEIRPRNQWLVKSRQSGLLTKRVSKRGECVPVFRSEHPHRTNRVQTGETYEGPYLEFELFEGEIEPTTGLTYTFQTTSNFQPVRTQTSASLPGELNRFQLENTFLTLPDMGNDLIFVRRTTEAGRIRSTLIQ